MRGFHGALAAVSAIALLAGAGAGAAQAQAFGTGQFYGKAFGGATWPSSEDFGLRERNFGRIGDLRLNYDTGYTLGLGVGYAFTPNVSVELEYAYRKIDFDGRATVFGQTGRGSDSTDVNSFMMNALYVFDGISQNGLIEPYVGAGVGVANVDIGGTDNSGMFAYQFIGGIGYEVAPQWTVFAEGRWFATESKEFSDSGLRFNGSFSTFDLLLGAKYAF